MNTPFRGSIIGSWLFTHSTKPGFAERCIYHYASDGKAYLEMDHEERRILTSIQYRFSSSSLTLIYSTGAETNLELTQEDNGSVKIPDRTRYRSLASVPPRVGADDLWRSAIHSTLRVIAVSAAFFSVPVVALLCSQIAKIASVGYPAFLGGRPIPQLTKV